MPITYRATYSPDDNKIRLEASQRLDPETYQRVRAEGFIWAPKQEIFVAPTWTPDREDLCLELAGEIEDDDRSLVERAEERAERFEGYSERRAEDAEGARRAVSAIADNIPFGQPILVGHHSERRARKDAERIESGMRRAVDLWKASTYWTERAAGAIRHAKYKELPAVRARRIKKLKADERRWQKTLRENQKLLAIWTDLPTSTKLTKNGGEPTTFRERALYVANFSYLSRCYSLSEFPRNPPASQYEGSMSMWSALGGGDGEDHAIITPEQAQTHAIECHTRMIATSERWLEHLGNRIAYEVAMLDEQGGIATDRVPLEKGGACQCWCAPGRNGWAYVHKVNRTTVQIGQRWGDRVGRTNVPFDKIRAVMSKADVDAKRAAGLLDETELKEGFFLLDQELPAPRPQRETPPEAAAFKALEQQVREGVQVVVAPQLFPTPRELARKMTDAAGILAGRRVLEPSAGTGELVRAIQDSAAGADNVQVVAVEINAQLCSTLADRRLKILGANERSMEIRNADFLSCNGDLGAFDAVVMNPPFENAVDIKHIEHAFHFLKPGGVLVALCANGPRQREALLPRAESWEDLPAGSFKAAGTNVNVAMLVMRREEC